MLVICCLMACVKKVNGEPLPANKAHASEEAPLLPSDAHIVHTNVASPREPLVNAMKEFPHEAPLEPIQEIHTDGIDQNPAESGLKSVRSVSSESCKESPEEPQVVQLEPDA